MARYEYLSNPDMLDYIDSLRQKTEFVRIIILNREDLPLRAIEGRATAGSININADSAVRRTGNLTLVTDLQGAISDSLDIMNQVTDIDTLIAINKRAEIEVGIKNTGFEYLDYQIFWIPLGVYVISNASVTYNTGGISISLKLSDKMALLNGEEGGTISALVSLHPYENPDGEPEAILVYDLIKTVLLSFTELLEEQIVIEDIPKKISHPIRWQPKNEFYQVSQVNEDGSVNILNDYKTFQLLNTPSNSTLWSFVQYRTTSSVNTDDESLLVDAQGIRTWNIVKEPIISASFTTDITFSAGGIEYTSITVELGEKGPRQILYGSKVAYSNEGRYHDWYLPSTITLNEDENIDIDNELLKWLMNNSLEGQTKYIAYTWNDSLLSNWDTIDGFTSLPAEINDLLIFKTLSGDKSESYCGMLIDKEKRSISYANCSEKVILKVEKDEENKWLPSFDTIKGQSTDSIYYFSPGDPVGTSEIDFVYPGGQELSANPGDTVVTILDKIKSALGGNFEYFFDVDGIFHFQEIKNYLNEGSAIDDLTKAINEKYFITTNKGRAVYNFKDANLISSYGNNPQYGQIKNDFSIYGEYPDTKLKIRYHLLLQKLPTLEEMRYWSLKYGADELGNTTVIEAKSYNLKPDSLEDGFDAIMQLDYEDWRLKYYFNAVQKMNNKQRLTEFDQEVLANIPLLIELAPGESQGKFKNSPQTLQYFLDAVDTNSAELMDQVLVKDFGIESIGRRTKTITNNDLNCMFSTPIPKISLTGETDLDYIKQYFIPITNENPLYDTLRSVIHQHLSYNNNINITSLPVYRLDANMRISVNNDESDIHGDYIIKSISLPLGITGNMTINAQKAVERI